MRAVVVDRLMPPEDLTVREIDAPTPGEGELRIEVKAAGCNFSDVLMLRGEYQVKPPLPFVPGGEVGGIVKEVGPGVADFSVGDRVLSRCALGAFAEEVAAPVDQTYALPDALSFEAGAALPTVYPTSYAALVCRAPVLAGETLQDARTLEPHEQDRRRQRHPDQAQ